MRGYRILLLAASFFFCTTQVLSQDIHWPARFFNTSNGLPQNTIRDIIQDDEGWLWISTDNGLCMYDGYTFRLTDQMKGGEKLERGPTRFLKEKNTIWLFQKKLIARYDVRTKTINTYEVAPKSTTGISPCYIDSTQIIFISYVNLFSFNKQTARVTPVSLKGIDTKISPPQLDYSPLAFNNNYLVHNDASTSRSFVSRIDLVNLSISPPFVTGKYVHSLSRLDSSFLFLGNNGRVFFARDAKTKMQHVATISNMEDRHEVIFQLKLNEHKFLIGIGPDIFYVELKPVFSIRRVTQTDGSSLINKGKLLCFLKDQIGNVWIGTNAEGLIQVPIPGNNFTLYRSSRPEKNFVRSIHVDSFTQDIWTGLYYDNIAVFDKYGLEKKGLTNRLQAMIGKRSVVNYIHQLNRNEFLVFVELNKAYLVNIATNKIVLCNTVITDPERYRRNQLNIGSVTFIAPVGNNRFIKLFDRLMLITSYKGGVMYIHRVINLPFGYSGLYKVSDNNLWIGGQGKALNIDSTGAIKDSLLIAPQKKINTIIQDIRGDFWLGTDAGLLVYRNKKLLKSITRADGLADDYFYTLASDTAGYIWGGTNKGLIQLDIRSFRFRSYTEKDGLQGNEFNTGAVYQAKDGRIFFGGISGLNSFYPFSTKAGGAQQHIRFTGISSVDSILYNPLEPTPLKMILPDGYGNLAVSFSAFNFFIPGANEYEYRLNNNKEWLPTAGNNTLQLFLTSGSYNLQVRLKDMPASTASIQLSVEPPFYKSAWFIGLSSLFILAIAGLIIFSFTRDKYQKQITALAMREKVQHEKERISRELHDDLGVKANLLSYNASLLIDSNAKDNKELIGMRIKDAADDMLLALRETMWTLKQEKINTGEVWVRFKNFISKMQRTYQHINFTIESDNVADHVHDYNDALNLVRILQESINNAIRHSGSPVIYYSASIENGHTQFSIRDEGKSFDENSIEPGDGLANMRYRAQQSGFSLHIQARPGKSTRVTVVV